MVPFTCAGNQESHPSSTTRTMAGCQVPQKNQPRPHYPNGYNQTDRSLLSRALSRALRLQSRLVTARLWMILLLGYLRDRLHGDPPNGCVMRFCYSFLARSGGGGVRFWSTSSVTWACPPPSMAGKWQAKLDFQIRHLIEPFQSLVCGWTQVSFFV